ncbi:pseudouridylate synthase [Diplogelasinospora grovesii]|uniref:Pseudouridylate synthase n=1 Tax=Diplogelasinospora grovesii TaxID=303347 RepID=A0AAN6NIE3_9PEZI|nr:pseudouridylate synthase [Diplogelasinospora grovesii]
MNSRIVVWRHLRPGNQQRSVPLLRLSSEFPFPIQRRALGATHKMEAPDYRKWTKESLVKRVRKLEEELQAAQAQVPITTTTTTETTAPTTTQDAGEDVEAEAEAEAGSGKKIKPVKKKGRKLDPTKYSTRQIALKLAYLGKNYNGFEFQVSTSMPTIEEELWKALVKSCLIFPDRPDEVDFGPWEYSKCGRTDRGVSAFGQVISIKVRSNRPLPTPPPEDTPMAEAEPQPEENDQRKKRKQPEWDPIKDEIPYCRVLNRLLPPDIRVMAWAPELPPNFSARFSCRERQYRYFFTQPAFTPVPSSSSSASGVKGNGWLDIEAMRTAAKLYEGVHDFRNFAKVDPGKQMTNFMRRIFESDIVEVKDVATALPYLDQSQFNPPPESTNGWVFPKVYYFHVRGSAFLWHQIRHMVAILFAVGQGLEPPSIVSDLLDVQKNPRKPNYILADEVPLVLWDCIFPKLDPTAAHPLGASEEPALETDADDGGFNYQDDGVDWLWLGQDDPLNLHGSRGLVDHMWEHWRGKKMDELLANRLLDWVTEKIPLSSLPPGGGQRERGGKGSQMVFEGGNAGRYTGVYTPVMKRPLMPSVEEANDRWAQSKGFANSAELAGYKNWRTEIKNRQANNNK